jgi:enoyl-CoA hydratase
VPARHISLDRSDGVVLVEVSRPPANALDPVLLDEAEAVLRELTEERPRAVVLAGSGGFFSAGVDLKVVPALPPDGQSDMVRRLNRVFAGWYGFPRPVVCAVTGHAIAGGMIMALCADHRVAADTGQLGLTEVRVGFPYPIAAIEIARAELPAPTFRTWVLSGRLVGPREALTAGAVDEVVAADDVVPRALEVARELGALPEAGFSQVKDQARGAVLARLHEAIDADADPLLAGWLGSETADAAAAALRRPD